MVRWAIGFAGIAIVAAVFAFTGVVAWDLAFASKWLFVACLVLTGLSLVRGPRVVT